MLLLKLSMRPWKLAPLSQAFSALAVGFLLLLAAFLYWMQQGLRPVLTRLQHEQVITAYVEPTVEAKDESALIDSIRTAVGARSVTEIELVGQRKFVERLKDRYPDLGRELEDLGDEMGSVVPRYVTAAGYFEESAVESVRKLVGVESAESSRDRYRGVLAAFSAMRWVAKLLALGLCMALLTGLIHLSRMNHYLHRDALSILRLWGAHEAMLRLPGLASGVSVGIIGGAMACLGWMTAGGWLARHVRSLSPLLRDMPMLPVTFGFTLLAAGAAVGLLAGLLGTVFGSAAAARPAGRAE